MRKKLFLFFKQNKILKIKAREEEGTLAKQKEEKKEKQTRNLTSKHKYFSREQKRNSSN
jgi:hypothetical protein